ncbi:dethiobiotin synthase [Aurantivibrio plasticivorans]
MAKYYFITGTDTEIGKTTIAAALLKCAGEQGKTSLGLKPVAAGCEMQDGMLKNEDALQLMSASTVTLDYQQVNPFALEAAIAPHIAAEQASVALSVEKIAASIRDAAMINCESEHAVSIADFVLVEGAGGWLVPLNKTEFFCDIAINLQMPVVLVVGIRLGCINHAILTVQAIAASGLTLAGWVANCVDPNADVVEDNIDTLKRSINAPCLGVVPHIDQRLIKNSQLPFAITDEVSPHLDVEPML